MKRKFYRANLPTVVWNPKKNTSLAEFIGGQFTTEDEEVASILIDMGYPEVSLDASAPPPLPTPPLQSAADPVVPILGPQVTEQVVLQKQKREAIMKAGVKGAATTSDEGPDPRGETTPAGTGSGGVSKGRRIKRRAKK